MKSQEIDCVYLKAILHLQNDEQIREKVYSAFKYKIKNQKFPISYSVADSLTFIDIGLFLEDKFEETFGLDSLSYNDRNGYETLYFHDNILMFSKLTKPAKNTLPLYVFVSKKAGNLLTIEISENQEYPMEQYVRFGTSIVIVLLVDENGNIIKNVFVNQIHHN